MTPEEARTKWVAALRSGNYEQGVEVLRDKNDKYCCLGVACDVYDSTKWIEYRDGDWCFSYLTDGLDLDMPEPVCEFYGLANVNGFFFSRGLSEDLRAELEEYEVFDSTGTATLSFLNDNHVPFSLIARVIEEAPEGLLVYKQ